MYDNERDQDNHEEEAEHETGGLRSTVNRFWERLKRQNHDDFIDDEEYEEAPATVAAGAASAGGTRVYGQGGSPDSGRVSAGSSYTRVNNAHPVRSRDAFRTAPAMGRDQSIAVMPVSTFLDVQKAADRLKAGEPQIINLEQTPPEVAERLIDFLNGVTYALDGYVEKVSEGAYLFTPSHIAIHADGPEPPQPKPYFDRL